MCGRRKACTPLTCKAPHGGPNGTVEQSEQLQFPTVTGCSSTQNTVTAGIGEGHRNTVTERSELSEPGSKGLISLGVCQRQQCEACAYTYRQRVGELDHVLQGHTQRGVHAHLHPACPREVVGKLASHCAGSTEVRVGALPVHEPATGSSSQRHAREQPSYAHKGDMCAALLPLLGPQGQDIGCIMPLACTMCTQPRSSTLFRPTARCQRVPACEGRVG
jgi:hypothetical protein